MKFFAKAGVPMPPGSRLERAIARIRASNEPGKLDSYSDLDLATLAEAFRTTWDAFLVTHAWKSRPRRNSPFPASRLACFAEGADLPEDDPVPKPRSTQFELFVTAQFVLGGADVHVGEPDLRFLYHGEYLGIAAKRITKRRRQTVAGGIRDARHQLRDNGVRGFIALNLDSWANDLFVTVESEEYGRHFNRALEEAHHEFAKTPEEDFVMGALIYNHSIGWERAASGELTLRWAEGSQYVRFSEDPKEEEKAVEFFEPLTARGYTGLKEAGALIVARK